MACVALAVVAAGCLKNDIPYPVIQAAFITMDVEHQLGAPIIDTKSQTVTIRLDEQADLQNVMIKDYTITEGATLSDDIKSGLNLSKDPFSVVISLYQD